MNIDETIYVNRPDLIDLDERMTDFADLREAIHQDAEGATEISILGGYYAVDALVEVCRQVPRAARRNCTVRIAVGLEATALIPRTWADMREVEQKLRRGGFKDVTVSVIANSPVHFHTKLFRILRKTRPVWYIGSANPGSKRHELMVRLLGRHEALTAYVAAVFDEALPVREPEPNVEIRTLRDFFLSGVLCHKPPAQPLFTFDAFRFSPEHRERLGAILAGEAGVEHARPRTEGFGFSLRSALGFEDLRLPASEEAVAQRIHYRRSCIETALGFWMPRAYAKELRLRIAEEENGRLQRLTGISEELNKGHGQDRARIAFNSYVTSLKNLLDQHGIEAQPVQNKDALFKRFLRSRASTLSDEDARRRLSRTLTLADMPDIWEDDHAVREFEASFFEDIAYRVENQTGGGGRVVRSISVRLRLTGGETWAELRGLLDRSLQFRAWINQDWRDPNTADVA